MKITTGDTSVLQYFFPAVKTKWHQFDALSGLIAPFFAKSMVISSVDNSSAIGVVEGVGTIQIDGDFEAYLKSNNLSDITVQTIIYRNVQGTVITFDGVKGDFLMESNGSIAAIKKISSATIEDAAKVLDSTGSQLSTTIVGEINVSSSGYYQIDSILSKEYLVTSEGIQICFDVTKTYSTYSTYSGSINGAQILDSNNNVLLDVEGLSLVWSEEFAIALSSADSLIAFLINGSDEIIGTEGSDYLFSGAGNDNVAAGEGDDSIEGGDGADDLTGDAGTDTIDGGAGNDVISAGADADTVTAGTGDDSVSGGEGADDLAGGIGADTLDGGAGDDVLYSGDGNDNVAAGEGADLIIGGDGAGDDTYDGGTGADTVKYTSAVASITVNLVIGTATSTAGNDAAGIGTDKLTNIENVIAGSYADSLVGSTEANVITGSAGNDSIDGGLNTDTAVYLAARTNYTVTETDSGFTVINITGTDGTDKLVSIERLQFTDQAIAYDADTSNSAGGIYRLYKAALDRNPDLGGLGYWIAQADAGTKDAVRMATDFTYADEFKTLYGVQTADNYMTGEDITALVTKIYENVLNRAPDSGGRDYYAGQITAKSKTVGQVLAEISDSAENKLAVAELIGTGIEYTPWVG